MATGLQALNAIESVAQSILNTKQMVLNLPPQSGKVRVGREGVNRLAAGLLKLEQTAQEIFAQTVRAPWPTPDARDPFGWTGAIRRQGNLQARLMQASVSDVLIQAANQLQQDAGTLAQWVRYGTEPAQPPPQYGPQVPMPPQGAAFGGVHHGGAVLAPVTARAMMTPGESFNKIVGGLMMFASVAGAGWTMMKERKAAKMRKQNGLEVEDDESPFVIKQHAQTALDNEIPGASVTLSAKPDGEWVASVKKGQTLIGRARSKKPQDAAGKAVTQALEYDESGVIEVDAEVVDTKVPFKAPRAKREKAAPIIDVQPNVSPGDAEPAAAAAS